MCGFYGTLKGYSNPEVWVGGDLVLATEKACQGMKKYRVR